ncbi:MAG TPA: HEAT repeat domain-containing protein [Gemmatimonadaceae bacterium]|nr:HEAT repeat domain-containing protein [Gemmatimonadaceae bacterium]
MAAPGTPNTVRSLLSRTKFLIGGGVLVMATALPLVARTARHDATRDGSQARPLVADDTASLLRMLRAVRGADPLLCELAVRSVDMHGWWSHWGPISGDPLETDSTSAAIVRWIQDDHEDPRLVPPLTAALRDTDACTRRVAGSFLGRVHHAAARSALMTALDDANAGTRSVAALGLGLGEDHAAVQPLIRRLRDDDAAVRRASAWALGSIEDRAALGALVEVLQRDADPRVRQAAAWAIGNSSK